MREQIAKESQADPRVVAALARIVLGGGTTEFLRQEADDLARWANEHGIKRVALSEALRHIADALDGPLAEAWERSVLEGCEQAAAEAHAMRGVVTHHDLPVAVRSGVRAALRALTEEPGE